MSRKNVDAELATLRRAAEMADTKKKHALATDTRVLNMMTIVRRFVEHKGRILYGGMAINYLLPPEKRFQNPQTDIPDQDFMTPHGGRDAVELADEFHRLGQPNVEVKAAQHVGTIKVYVDFVPVADVTTVTREFQNYLRATSVTRDGIRVVGADYLRMAMYLELSRPEGDVSRWEKVFGRLRLLNETHPLSSRGCAAAPLFDPHKVPNKELWDLILHTVSERGIVLMGDMALDILRHPGKPARTPITGARQILLSERAESDRDVIVGLLASVGFNPRVNELPPMGELVPIHQDIATRIEGRVFHIIVYQAMFGCHSQYSVNTDAGETVRVASIQTLLSFYLAFAMTRRKEQSKKNLLCISTELVRLSQKFFKSSRRPFLGFPTECIGKQPTRVDMMKDKREIMAKLRETGETEQLKHFIIQNPARAGDGRKRALLMKGTSKSPKHSLAQQSRRKSLRRNSHLRQNKSASRKSARNSKQKKMISELRSQSKYPRISAE